VSPVRHTRQLGRRSAGRCRPAGFFLWAGTAVIVAQQWWGDGPVGSALYLSCGLIASATLALAARRTDAPAAWRLIAAGLLLFTAGDALWAWYGLAGEEVPVVSVADAAYAAGYLPLGAALTLLLRRGRRQDLDGIIDGAIVGVSVIAGVWLLVIAPGMDHEGSLAAQILTSLYPVGDLTLLTMVIRLLTSRSRRASPQMALLAAGLATTFSADLAYLVVTGGATTEYTHWFDVGWLAGYVLVGAAALAPAGTADASPATTEDDAGAGLARVAALAAALAVPGILALARAAEADTSTLVLVGGSELVLVALVSTRLGRLVARVRRQLVDARRLHAELGHQATHDPVTGLRNRQSLTDELTAALARRAPGAAVGLLFIDLDQFKAVNDTLGHGAGDRILRATADRIRGALRADEIVARFGGDEFVVLLPEVASPDDAMATAERLSEAVRIPSQVGGDQVVVTATVGVVVADDPSTTAEAVLADADAALLEGKYEGRDLVVAFTSSMRQHLDRWLETENELRRALARDELRLYYQPEIDLDGQELFGVEALVRWQHPERGLVPPADFLPVAERSGLIVPLGRWVVEEACRQARRWRDDLGAAAPVISVNVSPIQLTREDLSAHIERQLSRHGLPASALRVELTETALVNADPRVGLQLQRLRDLGIDVAMDDFGTGYFSLSHLKRLAVNIIKIDRSFVAGLGRERTDDAIVHAVIDLARRLGVRTIAEGVETAEQTALLRAAGCDVAQGYFYARPMPATELDALIASGAIAPPTSTGRMAAGSDRPVTA
jgi:diguanylate cyclase (GGDEF)-like protein